MKHFLMICFVFLFAAACKEKPLSSKQTPMITDVFFQDYAKALTSYSPDEISSFYQVPLAVYSDEDVKLVNKMTDVHAFWKMAVDPYRSKGITTANPSVVSEDQLSKKISVAKVLWTNLDASGNKVADETNFYILTAGKEGLKISGLIIMSVY